MPVCLSLNQKSARAQTNTNLSLNRAFWKKTRLFWSQSRKAVEVLHQNRPKDMLIDETVYFVLVLKLCFMCLKSISLHLSCFCFFKSGSSLRLGSHLYINKRHPDSLYVMLDTNKSKVMMSSELGSHSYQCLRAVDLEETEWEWGSGGVV